MSYADTLTEGKLSGTNSIENGLVPRIRDLEEAFLKSGLPVIYTADRHLKSDYELENGPRTQ